MPLPISDPFFATPPEGTCPTTFAEAVDVLNNLKQGDVEGSFVPYIIGFATPAVEDQNKAWIRLDNGGRPLGTYIYYGGNWRSQYTGRVGQLSHFSGDPSVYFDGTGLGLIGESWDGWAICNGDNGTADLSDHFIITAHMNNSGGHQGYNTTTDEWQTTVTGSDTHVGGTNFVTLGAAKIYRPPRDEIRLDKFTADGNARSNAGLLFGHYSGTHDPDGSEAIAPADAGNTDPDGFFILPPYYAFALVLFKGYA